MAFHALRKCSESQNRCGEVARVLTVDGFQVSVHVSRLGKSARTHSALVRLFASVCPLVLRERRVVTERVVTVRAFEGSFVRVDAHVGREAGPLDKVLVTLFAAVATTGFGVVSSQMSPESSLTRERLSTLVTLAHCSS